MNVGMRNFHSQYGHTYPLARNSCLKSDSNLAGKCTKAHVCFRIKVEDIVILYLFRDYKCVSLCHRSDVEECVEVLVLSHLV